MDADDLERLLDERTVYRTTPLRPGWPLGGPVLVYLPAVPEKTVEMIDIGLPWTPTFLNGSLMDELHRMAPLGQGGRGGVPCLTVLRSWGPG